METTIHEDQGNLDAAMEETIRGVLAKQKEEGTVNETTVDEPAAADIEQPSKEAVPAADIKARDETGKFVKQDKAAKPAATESAAPAETPTQTPETANEPAAAAPTEEAPQGIDINRPPSSWKPAAKALWSGLPEAIRAEVYRREDGIHNGVKAIRESADFGQSIRKVIQPYEMLIQAEGGTPERAIADTMRTAALFRVGTPQQKLQALIAIDKQFNCGLQQYVAQHAGQVGLTQPQQQDGGQPNPQAVAQPQVFQDPRVDTIMQTFERQERERAAQDESIRTAAANDFVSAKDDKGQPRYPFIDNVADDMAERVASLRRKNPAMPHKEVLEKAYDDAVWANPETRAVLLSQQQAKAQSQAQTAQRVETAKRANAGNMPKRGAIPATEPALSLDEDIRATGRKLGMF